MDSGTLNYLAGFFEGRGTITFDLYKEERTKFKVHIRPRIQMIISQDDRVILDLFYFLENLKELSLMPLIGILKLSTCLLIFLEPVHRLVWFIVIN